MPGLLPVGKVSQESYLPESEMHLSWVFLEAERLKTFEKHLLF